MALRWAKNAAERRALRRGDGAGRGVQGKPFRQNQDAGDQRGRLSEPHGGHRHRRIAPPLGIPGEEALVGKGVHYCAACDGAPYRGKTVAVVGGGNSAAADALTLSRIAKKVYLIHRRDSLRATKVYHEPLMNAPNVEFCWNSTVSALLHDSRLTGLRLKDVYTDAEHDLACDGVFISVGRARRRSCSDASWRWTNPATSSRMNPPAPTSPACSPRATCAPRRCGRWSPPYRTAR